MTEKNFLLSLKKGTLFRKNLPLLQTLAFTCPPSISITLSPKGEGIFLRKTYLLPFRTTSRLRRCVPSGISAQRVAGLRSSAEGGILVNTEGANRKHRVRRRHPHFQMSFFFSHCVLTFLKYSILSLIFPISCG